VVQVGIKETVTAEELGENNAFLNAILATAPMRYAHAYALPSRRRPCLSQPLY
jgi:hypothetical protein